MERLIKTLKDLGWKRNTSTWYFENGNYCFMIGFQKSLYSDIYYIELSYTNKSNSNRKYNDSYFRTRITTIKNPKGMFSLENEVDINDLMNKIIELHNLIGDIKNKNDLVNFIMTNIISSAVGLNKKQKEEIELIQ